jgi:four helix bundle protein
LGSRELRRFVTIARGSLAELSYLLVLARDRGLLDEQEWLALDELKHQVGRLTWGLLRSMSTGHEDARWPAG